MRRFHVPDLPASGAVRLGGDEGRHLAKVLRARAGDEVELFDGRGRAVRAQVTGVRRGEVDLEMGDDLAVRRPDHAVTLVCAVPRGKRMEWLVEKAVEAGVHRVAPLVTERGVRDRAGDAVHARWERAALEACKQCGRATVPTVDPPRPLGGVLAGLPPGPRVVADPSAATSLDDLARTLDATAPRAVFVGPEGGFTDDEARRLAAAGALPVGLGGLILRIETAATLAVHRLAWG